MPADVTGTNMIVKDSSGKSRYEFKQGPVFTNILLADEINRATPKTQSALLEAMQEHTVTVAGATYSLEEPFFVLATQNPIEQDGTYPLPEAQLDRFMLKLLVTYPNMRELAQIVTITQETEEERANAVCNQKDLLMMREIAKEILVADPVMDYTLRLVLATQPGSEISSPVAKQFIRCGASPRAAQSLITAAKVRALMKGRYNVSYEDIQALAYPVLRHRIKLNFDAITKNITVDQIIQWILQELATNIQFSNPNQPIRQGNAPNESSREKIGIGFRKRTGK